MTVQILVVYRNARCTTEKALPCSRVTCNQCTFIQQEHAQLRRRRITSLDSHLNQTAYSATMACLG